MMVMFHIITRPAVGPRAAVFPTPEVANARRRERRRWRLHLPAAGAVGLRPCARVCARAHSTVRKLTPPRRKYQDVIEQAF